MIRKYDLPFKVGQEVEAKFNESGYRGAWFRCKILEIKKDPAAEPKLLLEYVDFPDQEHDWVRVRQADPAVKLEPWLKKKKPLIWMVRPPAPIVHESNVEKYQEDVRMGRKCSGYVHVYNDTYMVGDMVDWWKDDCFWVAQIVEIKTETNEAKLKFAPPPLGEGTTQMAPLKELRPCFSWNPVNQWRQLGLKKKEARTGAEKCKSDKPHIRLVHLSGDSTIPAVVLDDRCGPFSSGNTNSVCKLESDELAVNSRGTPGEERHNNSGSHELVVTSDRLHEESKCVLVPSQSTSDASHETKKHIVYARSKLRINSIISGAVSSTKQEAPAEVKLEKGRRKVCCNSSFTMSGSDEEEQRSWPFPRNPLAKDGARSSINDSEMVLEFELLNLIPSTARALCLDASTAPSQPVATSPTGGEMDSRAALVIADETTGELENISSFLEFDTTPEHLRNGTAVGVNDSVATANEDLPHVKFVIPDAALENVVSTRSTPSNADDRNDTLSEVAVSVTKYDTVTCSSAGNANSSCVGAAELAVNSPEREDPKDGVAVLELVADKITLPVESTGTCLTIGNADGLGDQMAEVDGDGTSEIRPQVHLLVPAGNVPVLENPPSPDNIAGCADGLSGARAEVYFFDHDGVTAPRDETTDSVYDFGNIVAVDATSEGRLEVHLHVPAETAAALKNPRRTDSTTAQPEAMVSAPSVADSESAPTPPRMCGLGGDLHLEQATGSPTKVVIKDASAPLSGQMKLLSYRSCVAIKNAIDVGRSRKRRREEDQLETSRKRVCQIEPNQGVDLSVFQADRFMEEPLSSSVPSTPANSEKKIFVFESVVKPEPGTCEEENMMHVTDDSIHEPLWVLALPRIREGKVPAVIDSTPLTTPIDTEQHCPPDSTEKSNLEDDLDALERLIARVHVLGAQLERNKVQKRKKIVWKINDGSVFFSGEGEGATFDEEANELDVTPHSGDCLNLDYVPEWYLQSVFATGSVSEKAPDGEANALDASPCLDPDYMPERLPCVSAEATNTPQEDGDTSSFKCSRDSSEAWRRKSLSRRKVTRGGTKIMKSVRNLGTCKSQSSRQPETSNQLLLLGSGNVSSKVNGGFKRKQVDNIGHGKDNKKMRADVSTALVGAVRNSATPFVVDLPRMRGSIKNLMEKPGRSRKSTTSQKPSAPGKCLDVIMGRKEKLVESVGFQQEQQSEDPPCGHVEQNSVGKSSLSGFPTKSHLSSGSNHEISSTGKLGSEALEGESTECKNRHQSKGNSDSEVLDNEPGEKKIKLQPNGNWCIKAHTVDGKLEWIGNYATKEDALSIYDIVNRSSFPKLKEVPPLCHTSSSCLREQAHGNHLSPEPSLNDKQLKCSTPEKSTKGNASESSSTAVEPNVGSTVFIAKEVNETAVGISRLDKTSGANEQEGEGQDDGVLEIINKSAETCEHDSSVISTEEDASGGLGVETSSGFSIEGNIQGRSNTVSGATAHNLTGGPLGSSSREKVVNADKDIQFGGIVQDKPLVKLEVSEPQAVASAGCAHDGWIHDAVKCRYGEDALDRVNFETTEEIEVARQVKMALWRGMCCSSQKCGFSQGLDLLKRIELFVKSKMHFQVVIDGDSNKILLSTGKPGEEIYIGHYKTETEVGAARKVISRCKKILSESMVFFEASYNPRVISDVLHTKVPHASTSQVNSVRKESSSSLAEATELRAKPTSASQATGEPIMQGLTISREFGQSLTRAEISPKPSIAAGDTTPVPTSGQIPCRQTHQVTHNDRNPSIQASAALVTDHLPSLNEHQALVNSRAVAGPPGFSQNVIVLDDDDDNEVHVAPVSSLLPGSTSARAFTDATPAGAISGSLGNISIQRENTFQGNRASRTHGLLNDVISSYPCQIQEERCHLGGGSSAAGQIWVRQAVPNHVQTGNTGIDPIQRVGQASGTPDAQIYGRTLLQPLRQEGLGSQQTVLTPFLHGNVVGQQQPVNQYGGTVGVNVVNSFGRRVEIPSSSLQAVQGTVRVSTSHVPENQLRQVGNSGSVPTAFITSAAAAPRSNPMRKLYNCCPSVESSEEDHMLFKALCCGACNRLVHTECAIALRQLGLARNSATGQEQAVYMCACGRQWGIVPKILFRMKEFIQLIWRQQKERLNQDQRPVAVISLHKGQELNMIMGILHKILSGAKSDLDLMTIFDMVGHMNREIWEDANKVNFREWDTFIGKALKFYELTNQTAVHG